MGYITRIRNVCLQATYLEIPVFGNVDSHHFSSVNWITLGVLCMCVVKMWATEIQ